MKTLDIMRVYGISFKLFKLIFISL